MLGGYLQRFQCEIMTSFILNFEELNAYLFAINHFRKGTPNQWDLVAEYVRGVSLQGCKDSPTVCIGASTTKNTSKLKNLDLTKNENCLILNSIFPSTFKDSLRPRFEGCPGKNAMKSIILLPHEMTCCGKNIKMDNRPSHPLVYTTGTFIGALFHGECSKCKTKFYPSFKLISGGTNGRIYYDPTDISSPYFQVTLKTVFSKSLLNDFTNNI